MGKRVLFIFVIFLLVQSVVAENSAGQSLLVNNSSDIGAPLEDFRGVVEKTDGLFEKEYVLPTRIQPIIGTLFRFGDSVTISEAIIALMLLLLFAFSFISIMKDFGPFSENTATWIGLLVALIVSMVGLVKSLTIFLLNLGGRLAFIEDWSAGALLFSGLLIVVIYVVGGKLFKAFARSRGLEKAFSKGTQAGALLAQQKAQSEAFEKISKS
jgi:hypothetical protein